MALLQYRSIEQRGGGIIKEHCGAAAAQASGGSLQQGRQTTEKDAAGVAWLGDQAPNPFLDQSALLPRCHTAAAVVRNAYPEGKQQAAAKRV